MAPSSPRFAKVGAAADYAAVAPITVRRWVKRGNLTAYRAGRVLRVDLNEVDALLRPVVTVGVA